MKIISKFKDYYDYLQGIYGIDELLVLDRRRKDEDLFKPDLSNNNYYIRYRFAICGNVYDIYAFEGKLYHDEEGRIELNKILDSKGISGMWPYSWGVKQQEELTTDVNNRLRQPILVTTELHRIVDSDWSSNIILSDFKLIKSISAHDIFINLSSFLAWLKDNPEIPNKQSNEEKLLSHGFDKKKSFRHRK